MEKRIMAIVCRHSLALFAVSLFIGASAHAQLVNGGFELGSGYYTNVDDSLISTAAVGWVQFNDAARLSTNDTGLAETAHSGLYALKCYGPQADNPDGGPGGSGAYQTITNAVYANQVWVLNGYGLTPSSDPMSDNTPLAFSYAQMLIAFYDSTGTNQLSSLGGPELLANNNPTNPTPADTWISCSVTAAAPAGAASLRVTVVHVGDSLSSGSIYFDDLSVTNVFSPPPPPPPTTNQFNLAIKSGTEICWPTTTNVSYQPQFSDDNANWTSLQGLTPGDGTTNCVFGFTHKYYRVITSQ
ncbi:MAG TPA: hypothetical protein VMP11_19170 [Verrucomicrobiae bacterium]|nr:hypothetical protein [Verrucomicrobiae bacterium]